MNATILLGYAEAVIGVRVASERSPLANNSGEADFGHFLVSQTRSSRRHDATNRLSSYAGTGLGRSPSISRRIFWNNSFGTVTSAIWNWKVT